MKRKFTLTITVALLCITIMVLCSACFNKPSQTPSTSTHVHTLITIPSTNPTCTQTGLTEGKKCITCYEIIVKQEVVTALGHSWSNNICSRCGIAKELELDPKYNNILTIDQINWDINSVGGVEPNIQFTNKSNKQIAYIWFTVKYYDRMGNPAYCSIKDICSQRLKITGPVDANEQDTRYWEPVIYNYSVAAIKPLSIRIEYTDGTTQTITCTGRYWYDSTYYGGELKD